MILNISEVSIIILVLALSGIPPVGAPTLEVDSFMLSDQEFKKKTGTYSVLVQVEISVFGTSTKMVCKGLTKDSMKMGLFVLCCPDYAGWNKGHLTLYVYHVVSSVNQLLQHSVLCWWD